MTEKENYMRIVRGDMPEWLPLESYLYTPEGMTPPVTTVRPSALGMTKDFRDIFGVKFVGTDSTGDMMLPEPGNFILKDIHDWPDVIKVPNLDDINFEEMARKDMEKIDRSQTAVCLGTHVGYFQYLMEFMGFSEGLLTMAMYQDEVYELFEYMAKFYDEFTKRAVDAYRPDILNLADDIASAQSTFMSLNMYRELIKPFQVRLAQPANDVGIPINMHCCGKCEEFIEDWFDFNVCMWNPPQAMNDLLGIKAKYGRKLVLNGCSSPDDPYNFSWATEEEVRVCIRKKVDNYAPNGGYIFRANVLGPKSDETVGIRREWIIDEYLKYGRNCYSK